MTDMQWAANTNIHKFTLRCLDPSALLILVRRYNFVCDLAAASEIIRQLITC